MEVRILAVWLGLNGWFTQITQKNIFSHLPMVLSSHADGFGGICAGFEMLASFLIQWR